PACSNQKWVSGVSENGGSLRPKCSRYMPARSAVHRPGQFADTAVLALEFITPGVAVHDDWPQQDDQFTGDLGLAVLAEQRTDTGDARQPWGSDLFVAGGAAHQAADDDDLAAAC